MSDEVKVKQSKIRLAVGDITEMPVEAIVFYARPDLQLGSGFGVSGPLGGSSGFAT